MKKTDVAKIIFAAIAAGFAWGAVSVGLFGRETEALVTQSVLPKTVEAALLNVPLFTLITAFIGYSVLGFALAVPVVFCKAYLIGSIAAALWSALGTQGGLVCFIAIFPSATVLFIIFLLLGTNSVCVSVALLIRKDVSLELKYHTRISIFFLIISAFCVMWEVCISGYIGQICGDIR